MLIENFEQIDITRIKIDVNKWNKIFVPYIFIDDRLLIFLFSFIEELKVRIKQRNEHRFTIACAQERERERENIQLDTTSVHRPSPARCVTST